MIHCPNCKQKTVTIKDKYLAGYWMWRYCPACHAKYTGNPIILAVMFMVYFWILAFFGYLTLNHGFQYLPWGLGLWLTLDSLNVWLTPMSFIRPQA